MLSVNPDDSHVAACLLDFFGSKTPWQRRLWAVGAVMGLREVLEGSEAVQSGVLSPAAFRDLCHAVEVTVAQDPGIGGKEERRLLQAGLRAEPRYGGTDYLIIRELLERTEERYLARWQQVLPDTASRPRPERTARSVATHLLDAGFSQTFLHRWWTYRIKWETGARALADLVGDAHELVKSTPCIYEILVAFVGIPGAGPVMPPNWLTATQVSDWLRTHGHDPRDLRQAGGLLLTLNARDVHAAVERTSELVERLSARVTLGTRSRLRVVEHVWVQGESEIFPLWRDGRGVEVSALARENQLYSESGTSNIDAALELLGPLNDGAPGPAVSGGWAAIEALLLGPGDGGNRGIAGDRLSSLVACSFPRAELTTLAYAHSKKSKDRLADEIRCAVSNRARSALIAQALVNSYPLALVSQSDQLAAKRMADLLLRPKAVLHDIEEHVCRTLRRLYRQRNLVLHWGRMNAVGLRAALRTAAPLIGSGIDRTAHAWFANHTSPLELAARAKIRLELLGTSGAPSCFELLEP